MRPVRGAWGWLVCAAVLGLTPVALGQSSITNDCFVVSCPPDRTNFVCNGTYEFVEAGLTISNRCPTALLPAHSIECDPVLGTVLEMGVRPVACRVVAGGETVAECRFVITVRSTLAAPVIQCPTNRVVVVPCDTNCVPVFYALPEVTGGAVMSCSPPPGSCFPVGLSFVTCIATNDCGDRDGCSFAVRVLTEPPLILCPTNVFGVFRPCSSNCMPVMYPLPEVRYGTLIECTPPPGTCLGAGEPRTVVYTVTCRATNDCGAIAQCAFPIRVETDPNVYYPPDLGLPLRNYVFTNHCGTGCVPAPYSLPIIRHGWIESCIPPPGTCLPVGTNRVTCRATNVCRLSASFSFNVQIVPGPGHLPTFANVTDVVVTNCSTNCMVVNYPLPVASPGAVVRCDPPSGSCFRVGYTGVNCLASNECGWGYTSFLVQVEYKSGPPIILCPTNRVAILPCGDYDMPIEYEMPEVINGTLVECSNPPGQRLPVGNWQIRCSATNSCGDLSTCYFAFKIQREAPVEFLNFPTNRLLTIPCDSDSSCVTLTYDTPGITNATLISCSPPSGTCLPVGFHPIVCLYTDACGDRGGQAAYIRVETAPPPIIQCPTSPLAYPVPFNVLCWASDFCHEVNYPLPAVQNGTLIECIPPPGTCFSLGTNGSTIQHRVTCRATNNCGVPAQCSFQIILYGDARAPRLHCPGVYITSQCGQSCVPVVYPPSSFPAGWPVNCTPPTGTCMPIGTTQVVCTGRNWCGTDVCFFEVRVSPDRNLGPTIATPNTVIVTNCSTNCLVVNYPLPTASTGATVHCTPPPGTCFPRGYTAVTCVARNECSPSLPSSFYVNVMYNATNAPVLRLETRDGGRFLHWGNQCPGTARLQTASEPEGPWETIPDAVPGYAVTPSERRQYFRVKVE